MKRGEYVIAPHRIVDYQLERVVYGTGDKVPLADAVKYGLIEGDVVETTQTPKKKPTTKRRGSKRAAKPAENRARTPAEDR